MTEEQNSQIKTATDSIVVVILEADDAIAEFQKKILDSVSYAMKYNADEALRGEARKHWAVKILKAFDKASKQTQANEESLTSPEARRDYFNVVLREQYEDLIDILHDALKNSISTMISNGGRKSQIDIEIIGGCLGLTDSKFSAMGVLEDYLAKAS